jgi:hypothetical protein
MYQLGDENLQKDFHLNLIDKNEGSFKTIPIYIPNP